MQDALKEKHGDCALITLGTSGVRAELADQIAAKALNVGVASKEAEPQEKVSRLKSKYGADAKYILTDLATPEGSKPSRPLMWRPVFVWVPLVLMILFARPEATGAYDTYLTGLLRTNVISLVFDINGLRLWPRGDRAVPGYN